MVGLSREGSSERWSTVHAVAGQAAGRTMLQRNDAACEESLSEEQTAGGRRSGERALVRARVCGEEPTIHPALLQQSWTKRWGEMAAGCRGGRLIVM